MHFVSFLFPLRFTLQFHFRGHKLFFLKKTFKLSRLLSLTLRGKQSNDLGRCNPHRNRKCAKKNHIAELELYSFALEQALISKTFRGKANGKLC